MQLSNEWFAAAENTDNGIVIIRGRLHIDTVRCSGRYTSRVEIQWLLNGDEKGMPTDTETEAIDRIMGLAYDALERSNTAILTAIYTGAKQVRYVFYAINATALTDKIEPLFNVCGNLPIRIGATLDKDWTAYTAMIAEQAIKQNY